VETGLPSPAEDVLLETNNLEEHLIRNPQATYLFRVQGESMLDAGILPGDAVLVERRKEAKTTGKELGLVPVGREALETTRIEGGLARLGPDLNEKIVPPEANLEGIAFSLSKGCYPGQEVVARMDTYGSVKRRMVGLVLETEIPQLPESGAKIFSGTREVGWVSSSTHSPLVKKSIALGFPLRDFTQPQTQLEIEIQDQRFPAFVSALPFTASH
jgi:folate-binding protein YgfZ